MGQLRATSLQALTFAPTQDMVPAGQTVTTRFALTASQTAGSTTTTDTDSVTTVVVTALNYVDGPSKGLGLLIGTPGQDIITAHGSLNVILGRGGPAVIFAGDGLAVVDVGAGNATVTLGGALNAVNGGNGNVTVTGAPGGLTSVTLGNGSNVVTIGGKSDVVLLGNGNNIVSGTQGMAFIQTGSGQDSISVGGSDNTIDAGGGQNTIASNGSRDVFVLPKAGQGFNTIGGFSLASDDVLNVSAALDATKWNGKSSTLGNYLKVSSAAGDTTLAIAPTGSGAGTPIAKLTGTGPLTLADLLTHHALTT